MVGKKESHVHEPATSAADVNISSSRFSLTQEQLVHELMPVNKNMDPTSNVDECVLNLSLDKLDIGS